MGSPRVRITAGIAAALAALIASFAFLLYAAAERPRREAQTARLASLADRLAAAIEWEPAAPGRKERFWVRRDLLEGIEGGGGITYKIEGPEDRLLAKASHPAVPDGWYGAMGRREGTAPARSIFRVGDRWWHAASVTRRARSREGIEAPRVALTCAMDVTDDHAAMDRLSTTLWLAAPTLFLLCVLLVDRAVARNLALRAARDRLEEAVVRERAFIADASHELRTPVSILLAALEVALSRERPAAEYRESLDTLLQTTRRMRGIVESLLTLARSDAGRLPFSPEPLDLAALLREAAADAAPLGAPRGVSIGVRPAGPVPLVGDRGLLRQLFDNLISNAIRYNREGGRVEIEVSDGGGVARVAVRDTGPGIAPAHLPRLFERFYRADKGRSRSEGGAGLGLAIAKRIAELHGGSISVESEPGKGSTFRVGIPVQGSAGTASNAKT